MLSCYIKSWSAWTPSLSTLKHWQDGLARLKLSSNNSLINFECLIPQDNNFQVPVLSFIPAMLRRKCSFSARIGLEVSFRAAPTNLLSSVPSVFASRHGEINTSLNLLNDLATREPLSPASFNMSVHNTVSGLFSIAAKNLGPSTAIAAGVDSFCFGLLESIMMLTQAQTKEVLFIYTEEPLPELFRVTIDEFPAAFALALLLSCDKSEEYLGFSYHTKTKSQSCEQKNFTPQALQFINYII